MLRPLQTVKKVCVLGPAGVGKSSLVARLLDPAAPLASAPTPSAVVSRISLEVLPPVPGFQGIVVTLLLFDLPAEQLQPRLRQSYYIGAEGAIVVADASDPASLGQSVRWIHDFHEVAGDKPVLLLANKVDALRDFSLVDHTTHPPHLRQPYGGLRPHLVSALTTATLRPAIEEFVRRIVTTNPF